MKSLKYVLIAALIATTTVSMATSHQVHNPKKIVNITFLEAIKIPGMVVAMYQQLNPGFLDDAGPYQEIYYADVRYGKNIYRISGTYVQWVRFFKLRWKFPVGTKVPLGAG